MRDRMFAGLLVGAAVAMAAAVSSAHAQGVCCRTAAVTVAYAPVVAPYVSAPYYIVNQGPVYSGPGIFTRPTYIPNNATFAPYPYVYAPGFFAPGGYAPPAYVRPAYRPRGAYIRRLPRAGVIDMRRQYGNRLPMRPSYHPQGNPPGQPRMAPPPRQGHPVQEKWTRGMPAR